VSEPTLLLDGVPVAVRAGDTLLQVARRAGVDVPTLCHDDRVDPAGACRMCLVEVEGQRRLLPSCATPAVAGQVVRTQSERVQRHRRTLLGMYLADHPVSADGALPSRGTGGRLAQLVAAHGAVALPSLPPTRPGRVDANPYIDYDPAACITCGLCTRYCDEVEVASAITLAGRGRHTHVATADQRQLLDSTCELCGGCVAVCPTGAMTEKAALQTVAADERQVRTTCTFCGVGCQLDLHVHDGRVVRVSSPPPGTTLNDGNLCVKGRFSYEFIHHPERLTTPLLRGDDGELHPATWEQALDRVATGLLSLRARYGPDSVGFISSSRCTGEENYLVQKLARGAFGTNNCHQCAAT